MTQRGYWKDKSLKSMSSEEWEALCDGCGKCCLHKLEDEETGEVAYTDIACLLLDIKQCRCINYSIRKAVIPDCINLKDHDISSFSWLPSSCAYRLITEGKDLPPWHPLISKDDQSVHNANISIKNWAVPERDAGEFEDHVIDDTLIHDQD